MRYDPWIWRELSQVGQSRYGLVLLSFFCVILSAAKEPGYFFAASMTPEPLPNQGLPRDTTGEGLDLIP